MEETEEDVEPTFLVFSGKKIKSKSTKNKCVFKKYKKIKKGKDKINNFKKIFNKNSSNNKPVNLIFTSDNSIKPFPLLLNNINSKNKEEYLIINEEMKINKKILENNLVNILKNNKSKSYKNKINKNLFSSFLKKENEKKYLNKEKEIDLIKTEEQKSFESYYGKGTTGPSLDKKDKKRKNISTSYKKKKKKLKIKSPIKHLKKTISLIKITNKPLCLMRDKKSSIFKENINLKINLSKNFEIKNYYNYNDLKEEKKRYDDNIKSINNNEKFQTNLKDNLFRSRTKSPLIKENITSYNNKRREFHIKKNLSVNNVSNDYYLNNNDQNTSLYQFKINLLNFKISRQNSQFSIFHFLKTNNIYIFIKNSKYKDNYNINNNKLYEIEDDFYLPPAYRPRMNKWQNMPQCIKDTCKNGGIALIKNIENCNIIWKLMHYNKMKELIRIINRSQKYNHFPCTFQLGRKDHLYKHIKYYKRLFPNLYNFLPSTYIVPTDSTNFENDFKKYRKAIWIVKPVNMSRGRGVHILRGESEYKFLLKKSLNLNISQFLISRYIDKPHIINKKKYDLRIYVLIASFSPLRIYLYNNGLVRFATEDYKKGDYDNIFIHLTNYSINKNNLKYKPNQNLDFMKSENEEGEENFDENDDNEVDDDSSKWSLIEYRHFFQKMGKEKIMKSIWKQIEDIVIKTVISVSEDNYKEISINKINSLFELYGFDIMIDENFRAWLIEVNVNPSLHCSSPLDISIKTDLITDIFNIIGIIPYNHNKNGENIFNYLMKKTKVDFDINNDLFPKLRFISNKFNNNLNKDLENNSIINKNSLSNNRVAFPNFNNTNNNLMTIKSKVLINFDPKNLKQKLPEYDNEFYKKIIEVYDEEKERAELTDFNLIFPLKNNIETYSNIFIKSNCLNDSNIVLWEYILNKNI